MVAYADTHRVQVPAGWTAPEFAGQVLGHVPGWLMHFLDLRDKLVGRLGFATQPDRSREPDIAVGGTAGPFVFSEVNSAEVRGGNRDNRMAFSSTFRVEQQSGMFYGILETKTHSIDRLGAVYLTAIWPAHKLMMAQVLRSGMSGVRLDT